MVKSSPQLQLETCEFFEIPIEPVNSWKEYQKYVSLLFNFCLMSLVDEKEVAMKGMNGHAVRELLSLTNQTSDLLLV